MDSIRKPQLSAERDDHLIIYKQDKSEREGDKESNDEKEERDIIRKKDCGNVGGKK